MNPISEFIKRSPFSERYVMDLLQDKGLISDNCVTPEDVCESDAVKAVEYLKNL